MSQILHGTYLHKNLFVILNFTPASSAGGFFTTGPPGREVPSQPSKIIYPETVHVVLQIMAPSRLK